MEPPTQTCAGYRLLNRRVHGTRTHNPRYLCRLQQILGNGQTEQNVFFHVIRQREAGDFADPMPHGTADGAASQVLQGRHETGTPSVLILLFLPLLAVTAPGVGQGQAHGVLKLGLPVQDVLEGREVGEGVHHRLQQWACSVSAAHLTGQDVQQPVGGTQLDEERRHLLIPLHPVLRPSWLAIHHHIQRGLAWVRKQQKNKP